MEAYNEKLLKKEILNHLEWYREDIIESVENEICACDEKDEVNVKQAVRKVSVMEYLDKIFNSVIEGVNNDAKS